MGIIFCIIGKSGSGKDSVFRALYGDAGLGLQAVTLYTTRPARQGERDGVDYHFITEPELSRLDREGRVIEQRRYDTVRGTWYYCTVDDGQFASGGNLLLVATLEAFSSLKKRFGKNRVQPIYLEVEDGIRLQRALNREKRQGTPDYEELCRRFLADSRDFSAQKLLEAGIKRKFSNRVFGRCVGTIRSAILKEIKKDYV
ncbi:MAG: guanylate kinase [Clostridia bacterium]|nr:guanylate kinase [Clostridia bacterium]MDR3643736.1 guanylate kinase [Clostridia bacterium]